MKRMKKTQSKQREPLTNHLVPKVERLLKELTINPTSTISCQNKSKKVSFRKSSNVLDLQNQRNAQSVP